MVVKHFKMLKFLIAMHIPHYNIFVLGILVLLVISNMETNPVPSTNNFKTNYLSIVHN